MRHTLDIDSGGKATASNATKRLTALTTLGLTSEKFTRIDGKTQAASEKTPPLYVKVLEAVL